MDHRFEPHWVTVYSPFHGAELAIARNITSNVGGITVCIETLQDVGPAASLGVGR